MPTAPILFAVLGTVAGLLYAALGLSARKYLSDAAAADRMVGWSLWWFAERGRYAPRGQRLCTFGAVAFSVGALAWVSCAIVRS